MSSFAHSFHDSVHQNHSDRSEEFVDYNSQEFDSANVVFESQPSDDNGRDFDGEFAESDGPILPPPSEMVAEEGLALREWRRENAMKLEEKGKIEKEVLSQIIEEANDYKVEFYQKREVICENNKVTNREKEKLFLTKHESFHAEVDKSYWKAIAELIPNEVPTIVKRGKNDQEKKPALVVIQGPKPGKPTELSRMRQILLKLKHSTPPHLKLSPPPAQDHSKDAINNDASLPATSSKDAVAVPPEAVVVA
ncbi:hypothetical protein K2173_002928 [Erythroxylum novogranatense]|uniref:Clathrin light chain n=1 Tax=Erythroxylum novogranatense TaxID=1862640 RepID=A0AAV8TRS4_9ROSI|nr:hypothetical protein K2173_002928 [Erythroxylum novogranatense]